MENWLQKKRVQFDKIGRREIEILNFRQKLYNALKKR